MRLQTSQSSLFGEWQGSGPFEISAHRACNAVGFSQVFEKTEEPRSRLIRDRKLSAPRRQRSGIGGVVTHAPLPHHRTCGSRIRRFGGLSRASASGKTKESQRVEVGIGERDLHGLRPRQMRWAASAGSRCSGKSRAHATLAQLRESASWPPPLLPLHRPQATAHPAIKVPQHRRGLTEPEVGSPATHER